MSEWTNWGGGDKCPVDEDEMIDIRFRCGEVIEAAHMFRAGAFEWEHEDADYDIVAYRVVK